jgi:hypothetical protein
LFGSKDRIVNLSNFNTDIILVLLIYLRRAIGHNEQIHDKSEWGVVGGGAALKHGNP